MNKKDIESSQVDEPREVSVKHDDGIPYNYSISASSKRVANKGKAMKTDTKELNETNDFISVVESRFMQDYGANRKMFPTCSAIKINDKGDLKKQNFFRMIDGLKKKYRW